MIFFIQLLSSVSIFFIGYQLIRELDKEFMDAIRHKRWAVVMIGIYLFVIAFLNRQIDAGVGILGSFFWGSLALAAFCDYCTMEVYDLVYLPALVAGIMMLSTSPDVELTELLIFVLVQALLFRRLFGISDCIAFSVCALWMTSSGGTMLEYALHMGVTMFLLIVVQGSKGNINRKGNLKQKVAMIPYIAVAMLFFQ